MLKSLNQKTWMETPAKNMIKKRNIQRSFLIGYTNSKKTTSFPIKRDFLHYEDQIIKSRTKNVSFY